MTTRKKTKANAAEHSGVAGMIEMREGAMSPVVGIGGLRKCAEDVVRGKEALVREQPEALSLGNPMVRSPEEIRNTLHELRVHQSELEMQNEELLRTQGELETLRARHFDLYDMAPVGYLTISADGLILEGNLTAATLFLGIY